MSESPKRKTPTEKEIHQKVWGDPQKETENSVKWWKEGKHKTGQSLEHFRSKNIETDTRTKRSSKKAAQSTLKKMILVLCPVCESTYVLTGEDRFKYLQKLKRKEMKYGRPCSMECSGRMRLPEVRARMLDVSRLYKNL